MEKRKIHIVEERTGEFEQNKRPRVDPQHFPKHSNQPYERSPSPDHEAEIKSGASDEVESNNDIMVMEPVHNLPAQTLSQQLSIHSGLPNNNNNNNNCRVTWYAPGRDNKKTGAFYDKVVKNADILENGTVIACKREVWFIIHMASISLNITNSTGLPITWDEMNKGVTSESSKERGPLYWPTLDPTHTLYKLRFNHEDAYTLTWNNNEGSVIATNQIRVIVKRPQDDSVVGVKHKTNKMIRSSSPSQAASPSATVHALLPANYTICYKQEPAKMISNIVFLLPEDQLHQDCVFSALTQRLGYTHSSNKVFFSDKLRNILLCNVDHYIRHQIQFALFNECLLFIPYSSRGGIRDVAEVTIPRESSLTMEVRVGLGETVSLEQLTPDQRIIARSFKKRQLHEGFMTLCNVEENSSDQFYEYLKAWLCLTNRAEQQDVYISLKVEPIASPPIANAQLDTTTQIDTVTNATFDYLFQELQPVPTELETSFYGSFEIVISGTPIICWLIDQKRDKIVESLAKRKIKLIDISLTSVKRVAKAMQDPRNKPFIDRMFTLICKMLRNTVDKDCASLNKARTRNPPADPLDNFLLCTESDEDQFFSWKLSSESEDTNLFDDLWSGYCPRTTFPKVSWIFGRYLRRPKFDTTLYDNIISKATRLKDGTEFKCRIIIWLLINVPNSTLQISDSKGRRHELNQRHGPIYWPDYHPTHALYKLQFSSQCTYTLTWYNNEGSVIATNHIQASHRFKIPSTAKRTSTSSPNPRISPSASTIMAFLPANYSIHSKTMLNKISNIMFLLPEDQFCYAAIFQVLKGLGFKSASEAKWFFFTKDDCNVLLCNIGFLLRNRQYRDYFNEFLMFVPSEDNIECVSTVIIPNEPVLLLKARVGSGETLHFDKLTIEQQTIVRFFGQREGHIALGKVSSPRLSVYLTSWLFLANPKLQNDIFIQVEDEESDSSYQDNVIKMAEETKILNPYSKLLIKDSQYTLIDIDDDKLVTLLDDNGDTKEGLQLPEGDLGFQIQSEFLAGKSLEVSVQAAMGTQQIVSWKEDKA